MVSLPTVKPKKYYRMREDGSIEVSDKLPEGTTLAEIPEVKMPSRAWRERNVCTRKD